MNSRMLFALILTYTFATDLCSPVAVRDNYFKYLPESSDSLPVLDIEENPPNEFDPKEADLDPVRLREKLGVAYKSDFMSPDKPEPFMRPGGENSPHFADHERIRGRPSGRMPSKLRKLDFDQPKGKTPVSLSRKQRRKLALWLWQTTSCPVMYKWKNIGHRFWPPWIKEGVCDTARSCSIPAGMGCQPSDSMTITILRWHCQGFTTSSKMQYCTWIKVQYPIISECKCKC